MSWQRVRGHDAQIKSFAKAVRRGRLAHAYLFSGPAGIGKRLFAHELARALLCENPAPGKLEACDHCRTYIKSIDLTKNGLAVPVVDELASVPLDIWAEEHGYTKLQPNLLGM